MSEAERSEAVAEVIRKVLGPDGGPSADLVASCIPDVLLRVDRVSAICGLSVPTIYRLMSKGDFPRPLKLTNTARAWKLSQVMAWIESRADTGQARARP